MDLTIELTVVLVIRDLPFANFELLKTYVDNPEKSAAPIVFQNPAFFCILCAIEVTIFISTLPNLVKLGLNPSPINAPVIAPFKNSITTLLQ